MPSSPTQTLFDRTLRTWIQPAAAAASSSENAGPFPLLLALIRWPNRRHPPEVFINDHVRPEIQSIKIRAAEPFAAVPLGHVGPNQVSGIQQVVPRVHGPFIFIMQGHRQRYFLFSKGIGRLLGDSRFEHLRASLAFDGAEIVAGGRLTDVFFDFRRNYYDSISPAMKRRETISAIRAVAETARQTAREKLSRERLLPTFLVHADDEFVPLLRESRETFADGYFFAAIASAVTAADRVCNRLAEDYLDRSTREQFLNDFTLGPKIDKLRSQDLVTAQTKVVLDKLNQIRCAHLHPKARLSVLIQKRDALRAVSLLHELINATVSVFRDFEFEDGKLVPRRLA